MRSEKWAVIGAILGIVVAVCVGVSVRVLYLLAIRKLGLL